MLSSCNEIVKQLVWNSLMKGLVLKVKLIYVTSAWSQSSSVIFWECNSDVRWNGPPDSALTDTTVNKWRQQHPPLLIKVLGAPRAPQGNSWHRGAPRGDSNHRRRRRRRKVQSNDRAVVIKPARPRPSTAPGLQVCHRDEAQQGSKLLCCFSKMKTQQIECSVLKILHFSTSKLWIWEPYD